jgi:hypothetical protein
VGLLAVDVSGVGAVMSADSQRVELLDGDYRVLPGPPFNSNPIVIREAGGFCGLLGYVGTESIDGTRMPDWLSAFSTAHAGEPLGTFAVVLADALTAEWQRLGLTTVLEIFIAGVESGDVRFWYVGNSRGLYEHNWTFKQPSPQFRSEDDLDRNYIPRDLKPGQTKKQLLETHLYSFREGVLLPAAPVFDAFITILTTIYARGIEGFEPVSSLDDLAYFARQRMEFLKRLYSHDHGIYKKSPAPLDGDVHVLGVTAEGEVRKYPKLRRQIKTVRPARL